MHRFWVIQRDDLYLAPEGHRYLWTQNSLAARRFPTIEDALIFISFDLPSSDRFKATEVYCPPDCVLEPIDAQGRSQFCEPGASAFLRGGRDPDLPKTVDSVHY